MAFYWQPPLPIYDPAEVKELLRSKVVDTSIRKGVSRL
jgi:hypothetical protein